MISHRPLFDRSAFEGAGIGVSGGGSHLGRAIASKAKRAACAVE